MEMGKLRNVTLKMERLDIGILGVSETRWTDSGSFKSDGYFLYYSGVTKGNTEMEPP